MDLVPVKCPIEVTRFRQRRDMTALIPFIAFWTISFILLILPACMGNQKRLDDPVDDFGLLCGSDVAGAFDRTYLFALNANKSLKTTWICVKACPHTLIQTPEELHTFAVVDKVLLANYSVTYAKYTMKCPESKECAVLPILPSQPFWNRCTPKVAGRYLLIPRKSDDRLTRTARDIYHRLYYVLGFSALSIPLHAVCMFLLASFRVGLMIAIMIMTSLIFIVTAAVSWYLTKTAVFTDFDGGIQLQTAMAVAIILIFISTAIGIGFLLIRYRLNSMEKLLHGAAGMIQKNLDLLLLPLLVNILILIVVGCFLSCYVSVLSMAIKEDEIPEGIELASMVYLRGKQIPFFLFFFVYVIGFALACSFFSSFVHLSASIAIMNAFGKTNRRPMFGLSGVFPTLNFHIGSVVLDSFYGMAIRPLRCTLNVLSIYFADMENVVRMYENNCSTATLSMLALEGKSFRQCCEQVERLMTHSLESFHHVYMFCNWYMIVGKLLVATAMGYLATYVIGTSHGVHDNIALGLIVSIITYILGNAHYNLLQATLICRAICYHRIERKANLLRIRYFTQEECNAYLLIKKPLVR